MFTKTWLAGPILFAAALMTACTTTGVGTGETRGGGSAVNFSWSSDNATSGMMTATFARSGQAFNGRFFQITSETRYDDLQPLWVGWGRRWGGWPYWGYDDGPSFMTHYSGRVLANLTSTTGERLRCNFRLVRPSSGMSGGGEGKCQGPDGAEIDATFPSA
ncbi:hypothetical protein [Povalibacter sp.]|uniref:hypothetical protein n=1 Tax=Povalibacter sp. TaxID=1962978 RepID=UPI002F3FD331